MPRVDTSNVLGKPPGSRTVDQDYELGKVLGKGAFGTVRAATNRTSGEKLACKSIAKAKLVCREDVQDVQREVAIMNHVAGHPNVVNSKVNGQSLTHFQAPASSSIDVLAWHGNVRAMPWTDHDFHVPLYAAVHLDVMLLKCSSSGHHWTWSMLSCS